MRTLIVLLSLGVTTPIVQANPSNIEFERAIALDMALANKDGKVKQINIENDTLTSNIKSAKDRTVLLNKLPEKLATELRKYLGEGTLTWNKRCKNKVPMQGEQFKQLCAQIIRNDAGDPGMSSGTSTRVNAASSIPGPIIGPSHVDVPAPSALTPASVPPPSAKAKPNSDMTDLHKTTLKDDAGSSNEYLISGLLSFALLMMTATVAWQLVRIRRLSEHSAVATAVMPLQCAAAQQHPSAQGARIAPTAPAPVAVSVTHGQGQGRKEAPNQARPALAVGIETGLPSLIDNAPIQSANVPTLAEAAVHHTGSPIVGGNWCLFHASIQGRSHLSKKPPVVCQDSHCVQILGQNWGVSVVCDGAGSHRYSHIGAQFAARELVDQVCMRITGTNMYKSGEAPSDENWRDYAKSLMVETYRKLKVHVDARSEPEIGINNVGCTVICVIHAPFGLLVAHIGDGQAGYRDEQGWHSMMNPFKGEYANQTVFMNNATIYASRLDNSTDPSNPYLETRVIRANIQAFALMSDGLQNGLCETVVYDETIRANRVLNRPYAKVFDPLTQMLKNVTASPAGDAKFKAQKSFLNILNKGNDALLSEQDDKTLVLGFRIGQPTDAT